MAHPAVHIAAEAARAVPLRRGQAGVLREFWADAPAIAWLRHMAGLADPADDPAAAVFSWHADADGAQLVLDTPVLGVWVRGVDTTALAEGLEALGDLLSRVTPAAMAEAETSGVDFQVVLPQHLKRAVIAEIGKWPPGVSFSPADATAEAQPKALDADTFRQAQATLDVQDHRAVIPVRARHSTT